MTALRTSTAVDLVLAGLDPDSGKVRCSDYFGIMCAGGVLVDLAREGRITVSGTGKQARARVVDSTPLEIPHDTLLWDRRLRTLGAGLWTEITDDMRRSSGHNWLLDYLVATEWLELHERRVLGLFPQRRHFPRPVAGRDDLVARLRAVLLGEVAPDDRIGPLASLLTVGVPHHRWVQKDRAKDATARAQEIAESDLITSSERAIASAVHFAMNRAYKKAAKGF